MLLAGTAAWFWETFGITGVIVAAILAILLLVIFTRRLFIGIVLDLVVKLGFGLLDVFIVIPAIRIPAASIIGGLLIFFKERTVTNLPAAIGVSWIAAGCFPLSFFFPGFLLITAYFPAVTLARLIFMRYKAARTVADELETHIALAADLDIEKSDEEVALQRIKKKLRYEDYVSAYREGLLADKDVTMKIKDMTVLFIARVKHLREETEKKYHINPEIAEEERDAASNDASGESGLVLVALRDATLLIEDAQHDLEHGEYPTAVSFAKKARQTIEDATESVPAEGGEGGGMA